jgi:hypothetical protein
MAEAEPREQEASASPEAAAKAETKKERTPRLDWAGLLRKSFALDVFVCGRCGGRRQVLAYLTAPSGSAPVRYPPRPLLSSPRPQHGLYSAYASAVLA